MKPDHFRVIIEELSCAECVYHQVDLTKRNIFCSKYDFIIINSIPKNFLGLLRYFTCKDTTVIKDL